MLLAHEQKRNSFVNDNGNEGSAASNADSLAIGHGMNAAKRLVRLA